MPQHFERTRDAYRALEQLISDGRVHAIGVSNFMPRHLDDLMKTAALTRRVAHVEALTTLYWA